MSESTLFLSAAPNEIALHLSVLADFFPRMHRRRSVPSVKPPLSLLESAEADAWEELQRAATPAFRERFGISVARIAGAVVILAPRTEMLALNRVWLPGSRPAADADALEAVIGHARSVGATRLLAQCPPWAGPAELFASKGFSVAPPMYKLCRRAVRDLDAPAPFRIERVGAGDRTLFGEISAAGNDTPGFMADGFSSTVGDDGWLHYLAFDGGEPIAAATLRARGKVAWCGFAGTIPSHRGRGAQSALLARRVRDAADRGCEWVTSETTPRFPGEPSQSQRNMLRLGFESIYERPGYVLELGRS